MSFGCLTLGKWNSTLLKNVNNCWNTYIYFCLEPSGGQKSNLYLYFVHFFNTSINQTSAAAQDSCFTAYVSNTCRSIVMMFVVMLLKLSKSQLNKWHFVKNVKEFTASLCRVLGGFHKLMKYYEANTFKHVSGVPFQTQNGIAHSLIIIKL